MRVLILVHRDLVPPETLEGLTPAEIDEIRTEDDVIVALQELGHDVRVLGLYDELGPLRDALAEFRPQVVFNLLEEFHGSVLFDYHVAAYLELHRVAFTGCNSRGLLIARDKALSKKILQYHRVKAPPFATFERGRKIRRPRSLDFPLIVKSQVFEASEGIAQASVVHGDAELEERVRFVHERVGSDAIAERYVEGRELYSAVIGNRRLEVMPTWELFLEGMPTGATRIATRKVKWDSDYRAKHGIRIGPASLDDALARKIARTSRRLSRALGLDGYVRIDYRLSAEGDLYFLEANPNPDIAKGDEFASACEARGMSYHQVLTRILHLARRR
jgi:D-alanine-D-alanine ligase